MDKTKISVIIPVYNTRKYLEKCVESVLAQTWSNLEIILVDDGATDGSGLLCDALARRDERIKVIHKTNGGLSSARNAGLDIATGAYIGFVDSDDYIRPEMYERLYEALTSSGADLSLCDYMYVDEAGEQVRTLPPLPAEMLENGAAYERMELDPVGWRFVTVVNRLCRRALFDELRFQDGVLHEDEFLAHRLYDRCKKIVVISDVLYDYVQRENSIMASPITVRRLDAVAALLDRYEFYRERGLEELSFVALKRSYIYLWGVLTQIDTWKNRQAIRPWVYRVSKEQMANRLYPSAARLWTLYICQSLRWAAVSALKK